jgi:hypothetical protein
MTTFLEQALYILIPVNVVIYAMLIVGYLRDRKFFILPKVASPAEAFSLLEDSYKRLFPLDKDGFTWGEAIDNAKNAVEISDLQFAAIQNALIQYEAYRYGGIGDANQIDYNPILKLSLLLKRKIYYG